MTHKDFAIDLARKAGQIIKNNFALGMKKEWKEDDSPLTVTDLKINQLVVNAVKEIYPDYGLITEEGGGDYSDQEYVWVCDPVDGTIPFSHGVPTCTFMLGLIKNGESILGVIFDPFLDHLYFAEKGKGAYLNDKKINVSQNAILKKSIVGWVAWKDANYNLNKLLDILMEKDAIDFRIPSIGYMDMLVATGEFVGSIFPGTTAWDSVAPDIIVREAGGKFTDLFGNEADYRKEVPGHLASNGILHEELLNSIKESLH